MSEVAGINLKNLEEPIREALLAYSDVSDGRLAFDLDVAGSLVATPEKPNSARSQSSVKYKGKTIGDLFVIAFKPGDGTGDEKTYSLDDLAAPVGYPRHAKIVPRSKAGTAEEAHMALLAHKIDDIHAEAEFFSGSYDLISLNGNVIYKAGELGHPVDIDTDVMTPIATYTVGSRPASGLGGKTSERFGDPHAIYNPHKETLQVAGFLAISDELFKSHPEVLRSLRPIEPHQ
jgi:hypothetical protein